MRRKWQLEKLFPNVVCKDLRGNVGTRIEKLRQGQYDAVILAAAGLEKTKDCYRNRIWNIVILRSMKCCRQQDRQSLQ